MNHIFFDYPFWYLLICLAIGLLFAGLLYYRNTRLSEWPFWKISALFFLRALSGTLLSFLLLSPYLKSRKQEIVKPTLLIATDNSSSMVFDVDSLLQKDYIEQIEGLGARLEKDYNIEKVSFGERVQLDKPVDFSELESDISQVLDYAYDQFKSDELGGIVLITDGIYNKGFDPLYSADKFLCPIMTVGFGDTTLTKDIIVKNVYSNDIAFLNDRFPIRADIHAINLRGNIAKVRLIKIVNGKEELKEEKQIKIETDDQFESLEFLTKAEDPGVNQYRVRINKLSDESISANNRKDHFIEIIDGNQKILLYASAPHPDIGVIKKSIKDNDNYQMDVRYAHEAAPKWADYNLVIFNQIPNKSLSIEKELSILNKYSISRIFILGSQTSADRLNKRQSTISLKNDVPGINQVTPIHNKGFNDFIVNEGWAHDLANYPPLQSPFGEYEISPKSAILFKQKIRSVDTEYPLFVFNNFGKYKEAIIAGEGIWKWRLHDYLEDENQDKFDEFLSKIIQYTTVKDDRRRFRTEVSQTIYSQNESIKLKAELYNKNFEPINTPDAFLTIKDEEGHEFDYVYDRSNLGYNIDIGTLPIGRYTARSSCNDNEKLYSVNKFSIQPIQLEIYSTSANHDLLRQIAQSTNGQFFDKTELAKLDDVIKNHKQIKPVIFEKNSTIPLLHLKYLLALIIFLLSAEWVIRRRSGTY